MPVLKLFQLYDEVEPLPVPDISDRQSVVKLAATAIFIHMAIKAQNSNSKLAFKLPTALINHYEFLRQLPVTELNVPVSLREDYLVPLLCNTYSTSHDLFQVLESDQGLILLLSTS